MDPGGIEPPSSGCKPDALPLSYGPRQRYLSKITPQQRGDFVTIVFLIENLPKNELISSAIS